MLASNRTILRVRAWRIVGMAAFAVPVAVCILLAGFWVAERIGKPEFWQAGLIFLTVLEAVYLGAFACAVAGIAPLTVLAIRGRRRGVRRPIVARALLVLASLAFCVVLAESIGAVWLARTRRTSAVPVGGLHGRSDEGLKSPLSAPDDDVALPEHLPGSPDPAEINLAVLGESSAVGLPFSDWLSIFRLVAWKIEQAIPGRRVRIQMLANSGDTLELQHRRLIALDRRPDVMVVYCGHNEFSSRIRGSCDLAYYRDQDAPSGWTLARERLEALSPFCEMVRQGQEKCRLGIPPPVGGHRDLIDTPAYTSAEHDLLLADFRHRLDAIVAYARGLGALVVLIIPPGNDAGFEPNRSSLPLDLPRADREAFRRAFLAARRLEDHDRSAAIAAYRALVDRQPGFAETHYRLGMLLDRAGDPEGAYRHFVAARDHDGYPIRCLTAFQDAYRDAAARHDAILIDGQAELHAIGRRGLLDDHLFQDAMHPSLRGQIALAQAILRALRARRAFGWPRDAGPPSIDPSECGVRFGLGPQTWTRLCVVAMHFADYAGPLRYDSTARFQRKKAYAEAYDRLVAGEPPEAIGLPNVGIPEPVPVAREVRP